MLMITMKMLQNNLVSQKVIPLMGEGGFLKESLRDKLRVKGFLSSIDTRSQWGLLNKEKDR